MLGNLQWQKKKRIVSEKVIIDKDGKSQKVMKWDIKISKKDKERAWEWNDNNFYENKLQKE